MSRTLTLYPLLQTQTTFHPSNAFVRSTAIIPYHECRTQRPPTTVFTHILHTRLRRHVYSRSRRHAPAYVAPETVQHLCKTVVSDKEYQASITNYRKGGQAFTDLVTIIPIAGGAHNAPEEADEVVYHVGF